MFIFLFAAINIIAQEKYIIIDSLISEGNYLLALQKSKELIVYDSLDANAWELLGKTNRLNQKYNDAVKAYEKANALNPGNKTLLLILAKTYTTIGALHKAIKVYNQVLNLDTNNVAARINLSALYLKTEKFKDAYDLFYRLHHCDTLNSEYVRQMGYCKYRQGKIKEAFALYKKSYQLNSENLKTIYWLADVYIVSKQYDSTINMVSRALKVYPENGKLYAKRGNAYFKKNHHYLSAADYEKAIEFGYINYQLQKKFGKSLFVTKKYDKARVTLEQLIKIDTVDYQICMYLGGIYEALEDYQKSLLFYEHAIELLKPDPMTMSAIYRGMGKTYHDMGQYHNEISVIKKRYNYQKQVYPSAEYLLEIASIYEDNLHSKESALKYYQNYYDIIKDYEYGYWKEKAEKVLAKINHLKEEMHFER
jgi:tetratricopeptide (TPR) repeat protein